MLRFNKLFRFQSKFYCAFARRATMVLSICFAVLILSSAASPVLQAQNAARQTSTPDVLSSRAQVEVRILQLEDERRWNAELAQLMRSRDARVRERATLAAGRIGDKDAVSSLVERVQKDDAEAVRAMAAFALGEAEAAVDEAGSQALIEILANPRERSSLVRARAVEAIGKIAASLPETESRRRQQLGASILFVLEAEAGRLNLDNAYARRNNSNASANSSASNAISRNAAAAAAAVTRGRKQNNFVALMALTAALRARPTAASPIVARFLVASDADVRATAANTLARLRAKDANAALRVLLNDADAVVRANAARALGAGEDKTAFDALLLKATTDEDLRVRVSALRAIGSLREAARSKETLIARFDTLFKAYAVKKTDASVYPSELNELFELAATLGAGLTNTDDAETLLRLNALRERESATAPELEIAFARIAPARYLRDALTLRVVNEHANQATATSNNASLSNEKINAASFDSWRAVASVAAGLGEIAGVTDNLTGNTFVPLRANALIVLRRLSDTTHTLAVPDVLRAIAAFKSDDASQTMRQALTHRDAFVRATAAELLAETAATNAATTASNQTAAGGAKNGTAAAANINANTENVNALITALPVALNDVNATATNDAALAILNALARLTVPANQAGTVAALRSGLSSSDHLVRRRAAALLEAEAAKNPAVGIEASESRAAIGTVKTRYTIQDYVRANALRGARRLEAVIETTKGKLTLELMPGEAPLTVDNFVQLARANFFNNLMIHRVVPNFVVQDGDSRGDGNGAPPYQIRCEINTVPYTRGTVGMALSGKDTGGSQWFVTHSPQPHLDGGYTVFARVRSEEDMNTVDRIVRGDRILRVEIRDAKR